MRKNNLLLVLFSALLIFVYSCSRNNHRDAAQKFLREQVQSQNNEESGTTSNSLMSFDKKVKIINDNTIDKFTSTGVTVVDFWATWCPPCRMQGPVVESLASEMGDKVRFGKLDVDQNKETADNYEIINIPVVMIFKDGKKVENFVGFQSKENLRSAIQKYL